MAFYSYKARDDHGLTVSGLVEAPTDQVAARLLREKHLFIITLSVANKGLTVDAIMDRFKRVTFDDMVNLMRQLATLIVAGLSIPESLAIIRSQTKNPRLINLLLDIEHQIIGGGNLAAAMAKHPEVFPEVYIALIRAGEASGTLDKILTRVAETLENQKEFRARVRSAMLYPVIILIGMIAVVFIMMTAVIPKLTELYKDFGVPLPFSTKLLIDVSQVFVHFWWLMLILGAGGMFAFVKWRQTPVGRLLTDSAFLKLPIFGDLQTKVVLAEFCRTFAMLIASGIHILDALSFLKDSMNNMLFRKAVADIAKKIEKGFPLGDSFAQYDIFPLVVSQMVKVGEETGKLDETLNKVSMYFEREADHLLKNLMTIIEPLIMVVLGLGVGFIVFAIITPIYSLTNYIK